MSETLENRIKKLEDIQEIKNLQAKYAYHVDSSQIDELIDLFDETFEWSVGFEEMTSFTSKPKLSRFLKKADGNLESLPDVHVVSDYSVEQGILNFANGQQILPVWLL